MLQIGITGGIGAGKSLITRIFNILGVPVYNADERAKWLMSNNQELKQKIIELFGPESYQDDQLNRKYIANKVFPDPQLLQQLNQAVHPAVGKNYRDWVLQKEKENHDYVLKEAALMFETSSYQKLDFTVLVHADENTRMKRVLARDPHRDKKQVKEIMQKQLPEKDKLSLADYVIDNNPNIMVLPQVLTLNERFKKI